MWLYGIHDAGGESLLQEAGKTGWVVLSTAIGCDPDDYSGCSFLPYRLRKLSVICRLNHGYSPAGTIPVREYYDRFAHRCANFVGASPGCSIWIIGNEPNSKHERPVALSRSGMLSTVGRGGPIAGASLWRRLHRIGSAAGWPFLSKLGSQSVAGLPNMPRMGDRGCAKTQNDVGARELPARPAPQMRFSALEHAHVAKSWTQSDSLHWQSTAGAQPITPELYVECYSRCRTAIRSVRGHEDDLVLVAAVAPWNDDTRYAGNEWGDWVVFFRDVVELLGPEGCDGLALHAHTHHADPRLVSSSATLGGRFAERHAEFRVYRDFLQAVPRSMRHLPAFITEADPTEPWADRLRKDHSSGVGWIGAVYEEIAGWNHQPEYPPVRCVALYRWGGENGSSLAGKTGAHADFRQALRGNHRWADVMAYAAEQEWLRNDRGVTLTDVPLSPAPGGGEEGEPVGRISAFSLVAAVDGQAALAQGLVWRQVREIGIGDGLRQGWLPEYGQDEGIMLSKLPTIVGTLNDGTGPIRLGQVVRTVDWVRMRLTPGYIGKGGEDVVQDVPPDSLLGVTGGPKAADGLTWWLLRLFGDAGDGNVGWMAETTPVGQRLLQVDDASFKKPRPEGPQPAFKPGEVAETLAHVRLRRTVGYVDKPSDDVIADLWQGTAVTILSGPRLADGLTWWEVRTKTDDGLEVRGWIAQNSPEGLPLIGKRAASEPPAFEIGDLATVGPAPVRVRRTAGLTNKPDDDVLGEYRTGTTAVIQSYPIERDGIRWLRCGGIGACGKPLLGWAAQTTPGGVLLLGEVPPLPGTDIPNGKTGAFLAGPFSGVYGIGQLWGENSEFYRRYRYDGVPLEGHNGIDFLIPFGTSLRASDAGTVLAVGFEPGGFGHFVLITHSWGESVYAHMERVTVETGQSLLRGERIGLSGNSGGSTGPHLHFAIRVFPYDRTDGWGGYSDPLPYLNPDVVVMPDYVLDEELRLKRAKDEPDTSWLAPSPMIDDFPGLVRP